MKKILVTGSSGLIGSALCERFFTSASDAKPIPSRLARENNLQTTREYLDRDICVKRFDLRGVGEGFGDILDLGKLTEAISDVDGIVHLAAVSRVIDGERNPERCFQTNVLGIKNILSVIKNSPRHPWLISASSREIYGQQESLPVSEDVEPRPMNVYARSKVAGEDLIRNATFDSNSRLRDGVRSAILRFSNVYGSVNDHADRVIPAFINAAIFNKTLRIDGYQNTFDFTHVSDVVDGICRVIKCMLGSYEFNLETQSGLKQNVPCDCYALPPMHFVSGHPTTLLGLAAKIITLANSRARIRLAPPRNYDVSNFYGSFNRAAKVINWRPKIRLEDGLLQLINDFRHISRNNA